MAVTVCWERSADVGCDLLRILRCGVEKFDCGLIRWHSAQYCKELVDLCIEASVENKTYQGKVEDLSLLKTPYGTM